MLVPIIKNQVQKEFEAYKLMLPICQFLASRYLEAVLLLENPIKENSFQTWRTNLSKREWKLKMENKKIREHFNLFNFFHIPSPNILTTLKWLWDFIFKALFFTQYNKGSGVKQDDTGWK